MAQAPEVKTSTETNERSPQRENTAEERAQNAARQATARERSNAQAAIAAARQSGSAGRETAQQTTEAVRQSAAASTETVRKAAYQTGDTVKRGVEGLAETQRALIEESTARFEMIGRHIAEGVEETADALRSFVGRGGLANLQEPVSGLVSGVTQTNLRLTREMMRLTDPAPLFDAHRQFIREYTRALLQGTGNMMRIVQQATEEALHPIEDQIVNRQTRGQHGRGDHGVVADVMSTEVRIASPEDTVQHASRLMRDEDTGVLPVGENDRLVGVVTDRDITLRLVAEGKDPALTKVREVMTPETKYVFEDEDLRHVADNMTQQQVRRLPVLNRGKRLVGIISLGDIARSGRPAELSGRALGGVSRETAQHAAE